VHVLAITRLTGTQEFGKTERSDNSSSRARRVKARNHQDLILFIKGFLHFWLIGPILMAELALKKISTHKTSSSSQVVS
jgi:hypothetical protein